MLLISKATQQCLLGFLSLFPEQMQFVQIQHESNNKKNKVSASLFCRPGFAELQCMVPSTALRCTVCSTARRALRLQNKGQSTEERTPGHSNSCLIIVKEMPEKAVF